MLIVLVQGSLCITAEFRIHCLGQEGYYKTAEYRH